MNGFERNRQSVEALFSSIDAQMYAGAMDKVKKYAGKQINSQPIEITKIIDDGKNSGFFTFQFKSGNDTYQMTYDYGFGGEKDEPLIKKVVGGEVQSSRRPIKSDYVICYDNYGETGYVGPGIDGDVGKDIEKAMRFNTYDEAKKEMELLQPEWCPLHIESTIQSSRRPIKSAPYLYEQIDDIKYGKQTGLRQSDFDDIVFEVIDELNIKRHFRVERPSWIWWSFKSKGMDVGFYISVDKDWDEGNGGMYADVLGFGSGPNTGINGSDTYKYQTDFVPNIVKMSPEEFKKNLIKTINDCLNYIKSNKTLFVKWR